MTDDNRTQVISAFIKKDDKYLLVYDPKFRLWRVPGGRLKIGEEEKDTIKREMFEELDIKISVEKYLGEGKDDIPIYGIPGISQSHRKIKYYECKIVSGKATSKEVNEISEIKWLSLNEIKKTKNLEPAMKDFFSRFDYC